MKEENQEYLQKQLITYIGNKRSLLNFIGEAVEIVRKDLNKEKLDCLDLFSGSGIVARYLKQFSNSLTVNDLELYSKIINHCYLTDLSETEQNELEKIYAAVQEEVQIRLDILQQQRNDETYKAPGFITELYSPRDVNNIQKNERCFYTPENANYIDVARQVIADCVPEKYQDFFIAPLLSEASIHANTAGIFKGFYKNSKTKIGQFGGDGRDALSRIMGKISLQFPYRSAFSCTTRIFCRDANNLVLDDVLYDFPELKDGVFDLAYFDPPYNQHPYGSNYFMLNLIASYEYPDEKSISCVSGIPKNWNRSLYNKKREVKNTFYELIRNVRSRYVLISFNSEGFISKDEMIEMLSLCGQVQVLESKYNTFRGSRNLGNRDIYVKEFLFLVKK